MCKWLLSMDANTHLKDSRGLMALQFAWDGGHGEIAQMLAESCCCECEEAINRALAAEAEAAEAAEAAKPGAAGGGGGGKKKGGKKGEKNRHG